VQIWNNAGQNHTTYAQFSNIPDYGIYFVQAATSELPPGGTGLAGQYYTETFGLGNEYAYTLYAMQWAMGRNIANPYLNIRYREGGTWGAWSKISAGYADSAGSATSATNVSGGSVTATSGTFSSDISPGTVSNTGAGAWKLGPSAWSGNAPASTSVNSVTGIIYSGGIGSQLFTFSSGSGQTSIQLDGSVFIGEGITYNPDSINGTNGGYLLTQNSGYFGGNLKVSGNAGIGTASPNCKLDVRGVANITNTSPYAVPNNNMQAGSLTIGDILLNYGGGSTWNANTAGLMMECLDNFEMAVHDAGTRIASFMYYTNANNVFNVGRDMGWGVTNTNFLGRVGINGVAAPTKPLVVNRISGGGTNNPAIMIGNNGVGSGLRFQTYDLTQQADAYMGLGTDMGGNAFEHSLVFSAPTTPGYVGTGRQTFGAYDGTTYTTMMTILQNGNVGIGRSDPGSRLSLYPAGGIANKILTLYDGNPADPVASATNFYGFGINSGTLRYQVDSAGNSHLFYSGATAYFRINSSGGVNVSDRRYKSEIVPISNALATIQQLQGITFKMQDLEKRQMGFIAQDVAKVIPEVVTMDENTKIYYMSYDKLTAVLCEGIKELAAENAVLKARLDAIEKLLQSDSSA
jgi:hypothetical protein